MGMLDREYLFVIKHLILKITLIIFHTHKIHSICVHMHIHYTINTNWFKHHHEWYNFYTFIILCCAAASGVYILGSMNDFCLRFIHFSDQFERCRRFKYYSYYTNKKIKLNVVFECGQFN